MLLHTDYSIVYALGNQKIHVTHFMKMFIMVV